MQLPDTIRIDLRPAGAAVSLDRILISIEIRYQGRYYFGTLLGLTSKSGRLQVPGALIAQHFAASRDLFLMDYKVPLAECDTSVVLQLPGGDKFAQQQRGAVTAPFMTEQAGVVAGGPERPVRSSGAKRQLRRTGRSGGVSCYRARGERGPHRLIPACS
jgi:hypothetical protein